MGKPARFDRRLGVNEKAFGGIQVVCAYCADKIFDEPILVGGECFCSENCASLARDLDTEDDESYFEESELEGLYVEDE